MIAVTLPLYGTKQAGFFQAERPGIDVTGPQGTFNQSIFIHIPNFNAEISCPQTNVLVTIYALNIQFPGGQPYDEIGVPGHLDNGAKVLFRPWSTNATSVESVNVSLAWTYVTGITRNTTMNHANRLNAFILLPQARQSP